LPLFDICLVVLTRLLEGRSPGEAGKDHTSHRLMSMGLTQRKTLFALYSAAVFFGMLGFLVSAAPTTEAFRVGALGLALLAGLYLFMMWARRRFQLRANG
jgi:UDP-GlcNAc:undecaprenyl-phosphate GlcNAc-1-phosphate transferase